MSSTGAFEDNPQCAHKNVCKYQSSVAFKLRIIFKRTRIIQAQIFAPLDTGHKAGLMAGANIPWRFYLASSCWRDNQTSNGLIMNSNTKLRAEGIVVEDCNTTPFSILQSLYI